MSAQFKINSRGPELDDFKPPFSIFGHFFCPFSNFQNTFQKKS